MHSSIASLNTQTTTHSCRRRSPFSASSWQLYLPGFHPKRPQKTPFVVVGFLQALGLCSHVIPYHSNIFPKLVASSSGDIAAPGGEGQGVMGSKISRLRLQKARSLAAQSVNSGHVIICFLLGQLVVELIQDYSSIFKDIQHFGDSCFDFTYLTTAYRCVIITARKYWLNQNPHGDRICSHLNYLVECTDSTSVGTHWSWRHYIRMNFVKTTYE